MQVKFFQEMSKIIALYDNLPTEINSLYGLETGHITISMSAVMSMRKFIGVLGDFHQLYPNITYNLKKVVVRRLKTLYLMMKWILV